MLGKKDSGTVVGGQQLNTIIGRVPCLKAR